MAGGLVLVTGGAGYIGSHTCVELLGAGYEVVVVDNLCNAHRSSIARLEEAAGRKLAAFHEADVTDRTALEEVFATHCRNGRSFAAVLHFAGLKAVGESVEQPLQYYYENVCGAVTLLQTMQQHGVKGIIFSSSATVYGVPKSLPLTEEAATGAINPYGSTKLMIEQILRDMCAADASFRAIALRYFNPIGAHSSGLIGEDPKGVPNNLLPVVAQVLTGRRPFLSVFGDDHETEDGTGVRDYVHVMDLAAGHVAALRHLCTSGAEDGGAGGWERFNLGTGRGYSVYEVVAAMEKASGRRVALSVTKRRQGDVAACYADASLAREKLGWVATRDMDTMCADLWRYLQRQHSDE